jgi:hypothetical protein
MCSPFRWPCIPFLKVASQHLSLKRTNHKIIWDNFSGFTKNTSVTVEPDRLARQQDNTLVQKRSGFAYVAEIKKAGTYLKFKSTALLRGVWHCEQLPGSLQA